MAAIPPFLQPCCETHREERQHGGRGPGTRLKQLHGIRGTTPRREVRHKATTNPPPTRLLAAPEEATTGPGKLIAIEQTATGTDHPEAVLPPRTGMHRAVFKESIILRLDGSCSGGGRLPSLGLHYISSKAPWWRRLSLPSGSGNREARGALLGKILMVQSGWGKPRRSARNRLIWSRPEALIGLVGGTSGDLPAGWSRRGAAGMGRSMPCSSTASRMYDHQEPR